MNYFLLVFILLALFIVGGQTTSAHFLLTNEKTNLLLHINPNDDPAPGEPARLNVELTKFEPGFSLPECSCTIIITNSKGEPSELSLVAQAVNRGFAQYTFPEKDIYSIQFQASPKVAGAFSSFSISTDVRISNATNTKVSSVAHPGHHYPLIFYILFGIASLYIVYISFRAWKKGEVYFSWN